jgi:hypothetical protein
MQGNVHGDRFPARALSGLAILALATSAFAAGRLTPYSKTTDLGGGKSRTEISLSPVHYYTADGGLAPIVTTVGPVKSAAGAGWALGNETNLLRTYFAGNRAWVRAAGERADLSFGPVAMRWSDGNAVEPIGNASGATPSVQGSKVRYAGVLPGIDAEFVVANAMLKKSYLLGSLPAMPAMGPGAYLEIGERIELGANTKLTNAAGQPITAGQMPLGQGMVIQDGRGTIGVDAPVAFDQAMFLKPSERSQAKSRPMPERLPLVVEAQADGSLMFWTRIPYAYLASADRMYPVVIDPQLVLQPNGNGKDAMLWGGSQANQNWGSWGWQQTWQVGERTDGIIEFDLSAIPPDQSITAATFSMRAQQQNGPQPTLDLMENTGAWDEATVTFNNAPAVGPVIATAPGVGQGGDLIFDVTTSVAGFYADPTTNHGWHSKTTAGGEGYDIPSSDGAQAGWQVDSFPKLVIDYEPAAPPPPDIDLAAVAAKLDAVEIKLDSNIPDKLAGLGVKLDALEVKLDTTIPDKLAGLAVKLDAIEIKLDDGGGVADKLDAIEIKLDDGSRFVDDAELAVVEAKLDDEARWVDDAELAQVEGQISLVEAKLDDETRFTDDAELAVIEAKLDAKDDRIESVEGKLDDETRFTDDSELSQAQQAIISEINDNEVKIDAIEAKLDGLGEKDELLQIEIEKSLLLHDRISHFYLPAAFGGRLELVREIVVEAIVQNQAAGIDVGNAPASVAQGDVHYAAGEWKAAYDEYQQAYRSVVTGN